MAIKKVKYNDTFIYINDEVDAKETGIVIDDKEEDLEKTKVLEPINEKDAFEDTLTDIFGGQDNE